MKFALYAPKGANKKGSLRFAFTGAEIKHLYNQYKPHQNSRATVLTENGGKILKIKFDSAGFYKVSCIESVFASHKQHLDNATVAQFATNKVEDYGFTPVASNVTEDIIGKWQSNTYIIEVPDKFFGVKLASTARMASKESPLLPEIKQTITNLNALLEQADKFGWEVELKLENKRITGKAQKRQEFDF